MEAGESVLPSVVYDQGSLAVSLAYPSGEERGVISSFKLFLPVFATLSARGDSAPCDMHPEPDNEILRFFSFE